MPRRYTARRKIARKGKAKRRYRAKRITAKRALATFRGNVVFPRNYVCKMRYNQIVPIVNGLTSRDQVFTMNSCYDPDYTGSGEQPRYFDQLSALYAQYRVLGCKIRCRYMPNDANVPGQTTWLAVSFSNDSGSMNGFTYPFISEKPYCKSQINNIYGRRSDITAYRSVATVAGVNKTVVRNDDRYASATNSSPSALSYIHCTVGTVNESSTAVNGHMVCDLTYYVSWERPITPGRS